MVTHNLPTQVTTFIGRTRELAEINAILADPTCRVLTLVGPGGIGKTRLALEATQTVDYPNGVHFVPLQGVADVALLPITIANAMSVQFFGAEEPGVQLLQYLRERQILLILDNFEHLLDGVDLIVELLAAPRVRLVVTSRTALNVQAEWRYTVSGLDVPSNEVNEVENFGAVQLFCERARRLRHGFSLADHRVDVIRIYQLTEGMPLALELAAGWIKALSCVEIANEIQRRLDFLVMDVRDRPERHRSMAATFAQSWRLLTEEEQTVFRRLSVFHGGFTREAAEKVAAASLHTLASLVDQSLLRVSATGRYDIHELLRQYSSDKLVESGEMSSIAYRHLEYFLKLAEQFEVHVYGRDMIIWRKLLDMDRDNLRAALTYALSEGKSEIGLRLAAVLSWFWETQSRNEGLEWLERMLASVPDAPSSARAKALHSAGYLAICIGYHGRAQTLCEEALALARQTNDKWNIAWSLAHLGVVKEYNLTEASAMFEEGLMLFRELGDSFGINHLIRRRAWVAINEGNYRYAQSLLDEGRAEASEAGDTKCTAWILFLLGMVSWHQDHDIEQARAYCQESLSLFREIGVLIEAPIVLGMLAGVEQTAGNYAQAQSLYQEALIYVRDIAAYKDTNVYIFLAGMGSLAGVRGELERAAKLLAAVQARVIDFYPLRMYAPTVTFDSDVASVRARLGTRAFAAAWESGKATTLEEIVAYALQGAEAKAEQPEQEVNQILAGLFTAREQEVLRLVVAGFSNAEIAKRLVVSVNTVKAHVHNIYGKLGVESRTQAIARTRELNLL